MNIEDQLEACLDATADSVYVDPGELRLSVETAAALRRGHRRVAILGAGLVAVIVGTIAFGVLHDRLTSTTGTVWAGDGSPAIVLAEEWKFAPAATVTGRLEERGGCLLLNDDVVVWQKGTSWDPATDSVAGPTGTTIAVGEQAQGSGGEYSTGEGLSSVIGAEAYADVSDCVARTEAGHAVVFFFPSPGEGS